MPYMRPLAQQVVDYLEAEGFSVADWRALEVADNVEVGCIPGDRVMEAARSMDLAAVDALVLSCCVQMPSLSLIDAAEQEFGLPVLSAATAGAYSVLRALGLTRRHPRCGQPAPRRPRARPRLTHDPKEHPVSELQHRVRGVDHVAYPTFDPAGTVAVLPGRARLPGRALDLRRRLGAGAAPGLHPLLLRHRQRRPAGLLLLLRARAVRGRTAGRRVLPLRRRRARSSSSAPVTWPSTSTARRTCWSTGGASTAASGRSRCRSSTRRSSRSTPTTRTAT